MPRFLRPVLLCLCLVMVVSLTVSAGPARKVAKYQPDIAVSELKKLLKGGDVARWDEFKGDDFYENGIEVPAQNIILEGGRNVTEHYFVAFGNDGTKSDSIRLQIGIPDEISTAEARKKGEFSATIYAATVTGTKIFRGDDVSADFDGNGLVVDMASRETVYFWVEIVGKGLGKDDFVALPMRARSLNGSRGAIQVSSNPNDLVAAREDTFYLTYGPGGDSLLLDDGGGGGGGGGGGTGVDAIDPKTVLWPGPMNVGGWAVTSTLTSVSQGAGSVCLPHTKNTSWPTALESGGNVFVNGNMWAIMNVGSARGGAAAWYAGIFEWLTPGLVCQSMGSNPGAGITIADQMANHFFFAPLKGYKPRPGEKVYFFVSAVAWPGHVNPIVFERTQIREWTWQ